MRSRVLCTTEISCRVAKLKISIKVKKSFENWKLTRKYVHKGNSRALLVKQRKINLFGKAKK